MVYALKSYNNNRTYKRVEDKNVLDMIIQRFSAETTKQYTTYPNTKKSFMDKSVQKLAVNSIIEGYFPKENVVRQMAIKRVNKMLCIAIGILISIVVISYYFVISCEMQLNNLGKETIILNNENEESDEHIEKICSRPGGCFYCPVSKRNYNSCTKTR